MAPDHSSVPPSLPLEILHRIVAFSDGATQKNVRLCSHEMADFAEPELFRNMKLLPQLQFLEDFHELFSQSPRARFIKGFSYDDRWLPTVEAHYKKLKSMKMTDPTVDRLRRQAVDALQTFKTSYLGPTDWPENSLLIRIFQCTTASSIYIIEEQIDGKEPNKSSIPTYIRRLCSAHPSIEDIHPVAMTKNPYTNQQARFHKVLTAIWGAQRRFMSIRVSNLFWYNFLGTGLSPAVTTVFSAAFDAVTTLDIQWSCKKRHSWLNITYLGKIYEILRLAKNLTTLRLCLHTRPLAEAEASIMYEDSQLAPLLGIAEAHHFQSLRKLCLESIACFDQDLFDFLEANRALDCLMLKNIVLLRESVDRPRGCFVQVIKQLRQHHFRRIAFDGYFSNGGNQLWYPNQRVSHKSKSDREKSLCWRVKSYVLNLSDVLPPELIRNQVVQAYNDVCPPSSDNPWNKGDCTWSMTLRTTSPPDQRFFEDQEVEDEVLPPPAAVIPDQGDGGMNDLDWDATQPSKTYTLNQNGPVLSKVTNPPPANYPALLDSLDPETHLNTANDSSLVEKAKDIHGDSIVIYKHSGITNSTWSATNCTATENAPLESFDFDSFLKPQPPVNPVHYHQGLEDNDTHSDHYMADAAEIDMEEEWEDEEEVQDEDWEDEPDEDDVSMLSDEESSEQHSQPNGHKVSQMDGDLNGDIYLPNEAHSLLHKTHPPAKKLWSPTEPAAAQTLLNGDARDGDMDQ